MLNWKKSFFQSVALTTGTSITSDMNLRSSLSRLWGTHRLPVDLFRRLLCVWSVYTLSWHTGRLTSVTLSTAASWEFVVDERSMQMSSFSQSLSFLQSSLISFRRRWFASFRLVKEYLVAHPRSFSVPRAFSYSLWHSRMFHFILTKLCYDIIMTVPACV